ncbi:hypothetical protein JMJ56_05145 [Belnapia sp. T18]|uniref:TauD/TfdA-like domain-containing protein n=1 Tax=Belnapia arida TaxID=2804533 RepID=A0ABS1TYA2_9PROT|nr:hypothetical protein [Belnapia arida]MBL6077384.1 hypothetical protein [Belnapia arida]
MQAPPPRLIPQAGPAAWAGSALNPADWMIPAGAEAAAELAEPDAAQRPQLTALLRQVAERLEEGRGFCLLRGLKLDLLAEPEAALIALGRLLGQPLPEAQSPPPDAFHADLADAVALLCLGGLAEGAVRLVATAALHNSLLKEDRAALAVLHRNFPYGEAAALPVFSTAEGVFLSHLDRAAMNETRLDPAQQAALAALEAAAEAPGQALALPLHAGDLLLVNPRLAWLRIAAEAPALRWLRLDRPGPRSLPAAFRKAASNPAAGG